MREKELQLRPAKPNSASRFVYLLALLLCPFLLVSCGTGPTNASPAQAQRATAVPTWPKAGMPGPGPNRVTFQTTGARNGTYSWQSQVLTSKLRHRLKEFTIFIQDQEQSLIIAFYGYGGPGHYTLSGPVNGGDVRLDFGEATGAWDLKLQAGITCDLEITQDEPSQQPGVDHMRGSFICPRLHAINTHNTQQLALPYATFDIYILLES
jgi:hypothetical protein